MVSLATASLTSGIVGLVLVVLSSSPAVWRISNRLTRRKYSELATSQQLYEDKDGVATEETEKKFSDKIQKSVILVFSIAGFFVSLVLAVLATFYIGMFLW